MPTSRTALRPAWRTLPQSVRHAVEVRLEARVVEATSQDAGFTPGLASRLLLDDGRRVFVKGASTETFRWVVDAYRRECEVAAALPRAVHAPRPLGTLETGSWFVAVLEDVEGRHPARPWREDELALTVAMLAENARALTPAPEGLAAPTVASELADVLEQIGAVDLPWRGRCVELARRALACSGSTLVHMDVRDDNVLLTAGGAVVVDWNFVAVGPPWFDIVTLLVSAHGDGLDADAVLAREPLTCNVDPDLVDGVLALLLCYFTVAAQQDHVTTSPYLRAHQAWYRDATRSWLAARRGWRWE